jgi:hypothetical protein
VPIEKREMFARNTEKWVIDRMNGDARDEKIVISGGVYKREKQKYIYSILESGKAYYYEFIDSAIVQIDNYKAEIEKSENKNEQISWLVADNGWTEDDKKRMNDVAKEKGVNLIFFTDNDTLFGYINEKNVDEDTRNNDKITGFSLFSHGSVKQEGTIMLDFDYDDKTTDKMEIHKTDIESLRKDAFMSGSNIYIYSCNIGTGGANSTGQAISNQTGSIVTAFRGKTDYENILASRSWFIMKIDDLEYNKNRLENELYYQISLIVKQKITKISEEEYQNIENNHKNELDQTRNKFDRKIYGSNKLPIEGKQNDGKVETVREVFRPQE